MTKTSFLIVVAVATSLDGQLLSCRAEEGNPQASTATILTPKPPATPRINGARVFGVRPGHPFFFQIPATGDRPMTFSVENLPAGLSLNPVSGLITGVIEKAGTYGVRIKAENALGKSGRELKIICGDKIALTPPLGWNSWNCFAKTVDQAKVKQAADKIVETGLINHGYTYVNIDDSWEGERDDKGVLRTNSKFPDMKGLSDYIHSKGLKFGIYSSPGPKTCGGYEGSYQHEDQDAQTFYEWGVDYIKYDNCFPAALVYGLRTERYCKAVPEKSGEITALMKELEVLGSLGFGRTPAQEARLKECRGLLDKILSSCGPGTMGKLSWELQREPYKKFRACLDKVPRDIVYSMNCFGGPAAVECGANSWRTTGDIRDTWLSMSGIGFGQSGKEKDSSPGHWNDPDMLVVGVMSGRPSRLTPDEQYTHISLWSLLCAPLLIGCDLSKADEFTISLLSNDEVLEVNQDPLGKQAARISKKENLQVWAKDMEDGSKAVGLFNLNDDKRTVKVTWAELGLTGNHTIRDLWRQKDVGASDKEFEVEVNAHGACLLKLCSAK